MDVGPEATPTIAHYKDFLSNFRQIVDEDFRINFGGGEALLFDGVLDLVKFSIEKGFSANIASNGWLIDEAMAERIASSGLTEINLSLDSLNEATHDHLRGVKGVYRRVMSAIDNLHKYSKNTRIGICSVIYDYNLDGLLPLIDWAVHNEKLSSISFMAPMQPNNTAVDKKWWEGEYGFLVPKNADKACAFIDKVLELKNTYSKIGTAVAQLEAFKLYLQSPAKFVKKTKCNLGRAVHVSAVGDIFLCFRWESLGNVKNGDDIRKLWTSHKAELVRKNIAGCQDNCHFLLNCFFEGDQPLGKD
jgi:MoaA/NifB/PqqE/SkfB family radical SAM enzyme